MNAHTRPRPSPAAESRAQQALSDDQIGLLTRDGGMVITPEQVARLGNGDMKAGRREIRLLLGMEKQPRHRAGPTPKPANVRVGVPADEAAIFDLMMMDLRENAAHIAPIDESRVRAHIEAATRKRGNIIGLIDGPDGKPVALVLITPGQWWWSQAYYVNEMVAYVHPDHRRSNHINDLLNFAKWVADTWTTSFGYKLYMLCGVLGTKRIREKMMLYRRKFDAVGMFFLYPAPPDSGG